MRREFPPVELRHGGHERQVVDVFRGPDTPRAAPLVVFVHGGYWQALEQETFGFLAPPFLAHGLPDDTVGAGLGISGLYDLEPIRRSYLNEVLGMTPEVAHDASPVHTAPAAEGPLLLTCGGDEPGEFDRQQRLLARSRPGLSVTILEQPDGTHFDACDRLARPGRLRDAALALVRDRAAT